MDTAILDGDFAKNSGGKIYFVNGMKETLQRCEILLKVRKGSFCYNRNLGSNLHLLQWHDDRLQGNALLLVKEALLPIPQVSVTSVLAKVINGTINLIIDIEAYGEKERLEMSV